jgi:WD repeat-containing protein 48
MISQLGLSPRIGRLLARDAGGETEGVLLNETVPSWVVDIVVEKKLPKFIKVTV